MCPIVWSKSDQRRLRKTLHKQTNRQTNRQTDRQTVRHYENNGHLAVNQFTSKTSLFPPQMSNYRLINKNFVGDRDRMWADWGRPPWPSLRTSPGSMVGENCAYVAMGIDAPSRTLVLRKPLFEVAPTNLATHVSCDRELWPMAYLTFERRLNGVKLNQHVK